MKLFYRLLCLLPVITACASEVKREGLVFSDTENQTQSATFMKTVGGSGNIAGEVNIAGKYLLDIVRMNEDLSIAVRDDAGNSRAANLKALATAKGFTIFTFSRAAGTVEVGRVTASRNICADYRGSGLNVAIADNMYYQNKRIVFRTRGVMASNHAKSKVISAELDYTAAADVSESVRQRAEQDKNNMIAVHYGRLEELIARGICAR